MSKLAQNGIQTFNIKLRGEDAADDEHLAALGRKGEQFVLVLAEQTARDKRGEDSAVLKTVKSYSENSGILEQLEKARVLRPTGTTIKQGIVSLPLAEVVLGENEQAQHCALEGCEQFETVELKERFKRCGSCRRRYYCCTEHQHTHWPRHKKDCKDLAAGRFVQVENRRRAQHELPLPVEQRVEELAD